jgi:hypothetical protein
MARESNPNVPERRHAGRALPIPPTVPGGDTGYDTFDGRQNVGRAIVGLAVPLAVCQVERRRQAGVDAFQHLGLGREAQGNLPKRRLRGSGGPRGAGWRG